MKVLKQIIEQKENEKDRHVKLLNTIRDYNNRMKLKKPKMQSYNGINMLIY